MPLPSSTEAAAWLLVVAGLPSCGLCANAPDTESDRLTPQSSGGRRNGAAKRGAPSITSGDTTLSRAARTSEPAQPEAVVRSRFPEAAGNSARDIRVCEVNADVHVRLGGAGGRRERERPRPVGFPRSHL